MTDLLERAIALVKTLPETEQDAIASMILSEISEEQKWDELFSKKPDILAKLAASAMKEYQSGQTKELDPDIL